MSEKLLKTVKMMNRFRLEELSMIFEEQEDVVLVELKSLLQQGSIKQLNDTEYLFTGKKKSTFKKSNSISRQKHNKFYYNFRDFYLLYSADTTKIAYAVAKEKYLRENPKIAENVLPDIKIFTKRLHVEFKQSIIDAYRYRGQALKKEFQREFLNKNPLQQSKRTIKEVPEYFDFSINENLNAVRIALSCHFKELLNNKTIKFEKYGKIYKFKVNSNEDYSGLKYGDLVFDILLGCIHLWRTKIKNTEGSVLISIDDLAFLRLQDSFKRGFKLKDKEFYRKYFEFLRTITFLVDGGEEIHLIQAKNKCIAGVEDKSDYYFNLQMDEYLLQDTQGRLETYLLKYPIFTRRREKRMGYLLNYLRGTGTIELKVQLQDVFVELGTEDYLYKKAALERSYLDGLLNEFKDNGLIEI